MDVRLALATLAITTAPAKAEPVADFYRGKQMQMVIRTTAGGGYDTLSRLVARHMVRFIPGQPTMLPVNMPGGGGIVAANFMGTRAPRDGTAVSIIGQGIPIDSALGLNKSLTVDLSKLGWIGNISASNQVLVTWHTSPTRSLEDARKRDTLIGSTGAGSVSVQLPAVYNYVLGTRFKIVVGYPGGAEIDLAMARGEVEGRGTNPWADYKAATPQMVRDHLIQPLIQIGLKKEPELPDVPLLIEQPVKPEHKPILDFITKAVAFGRPLATTSGVPQERLAALRNALADMMADAEFKREAEKMQADVSHMPGETMEKIVAGVVGAPADVRELVKVAIEPPNDATVERGGK